MSNEAQNDQSAPSATTPLISKEEQEPETIKLEVVAEGAPAAAVSPAAVEVKTDAEPTTPSKKRPTSTVQVTTLSNEYRFVHQRISAKHGKLKFLLPGLLLLFQVAFIVLFAVFGNYSVSKDNNLNESVSQKYPLFQDLNAITLLGFGFLMTFLKRYGYGSIGFNLLLVAFAVQLALIVRGFLEWNQGNGSFEIGFYRLVYADISVIAVLVAFGAVLGKTTLAQLVVLALIGVSVQIVNEYINIYLIKAHDVGRSVYVHLFGAVFGLAVSKVLHCGGVKSSKQSSVYHSDIFALIGTLFLWVYYPSFNAALVDSSIPHAHDRAIVNTYAAIAASCVVTFAVSFLVGKGKISVLHVQHATLAGGIAVGSVADVNIRIYVALIVGSVAGLLSTVGYQYIDPFLRRVIKLHDTCSVQSLHAIPGLIAAVLGAIFAALANETDDSVFKYYPARETKDEVAGRSALEQAGYQLIALVITLGIALVGGALTGLILRVPIFVQLSQDIEMFDDEAQWVTPDDYALKLTFATQPQQQAQQEQAAEPEKKDDTNV